MFFQQLDLTPALRPDLQPDESLLFVQDNVGLYQGKFKILDYQDGHVYLTSHRICYVDVQEPRKRSVALNLKDVDRIEFYTGFFKSSPKVTIIPLVPKTTYPHQILGEASTTSSPYHAYPSSPRSLAPWPVSKPTVTWICQICSFANPMPPNFDPLLPTARQMEPPACKSCGMVPELVHMIKVAIASRRQDKVSSSSSALKVPSSSTVSCQRCTFENDSRLLECEACEASLVNNLAPLSTLGTLPGSAQSSLSLLSRSPSPGPTLAALSLKDDITGSIKISFRGGGEKVFQERLKAALVQRKWMVSGAPPIPKPEALNKNAPPGKKLVGIARLEQHGQQQRKSNEQMIGSAFEDLEALMTSAKEIVALAQSLSSVARDGNGQGTDFSNEADQILSQSVSALGLATTKDMQKSDSLYISELSRNLAEFLLDDTKGILRKEGGIMSLVDVWAVFNRARNGVELVSPTDFDKAARMWEKLKLPIRLRQFKSGLLVVQGTDRTDDKTVAALMYWLKTGHEIPPQGNNEEDQQMQWDWRKWGRGVTIQETANRFGWSIGVATEELAMAEDRGIVCREQSVDGIRFWENHFIYSF